MKPFSFLKLVFVILFAVFFACSTDNQSTQQSVIALTGVREVTSIADVALGYLIETDSGQLDTALAANMKRMRYLDRDFHNLGTGECTHYKIMMSCSCTCTGRCCQCVSISGPIYFAGPPSISSVHVGTDTATVEDIDGIRIFTLNVGAFRGDADLVLDYDSRSFAVPVTIASDSTMKVRLP